MESSFLQKILQQKILPAVTVENAEHALPVAEAFLRAGLYVMEITFRTDAAVVAVSAIQKNFPEMHIGAGTLLNSFQLKKAIDSGAQFGLSSGLNVQVCTEARQLDFPFIPGVMTPSEIEQAYELGYSIQKLFPAEQVGGTSFLKALLGPYDQLNIQFIPMGGVCISNMKDYLTLKNVIAVGGSWLASKELMDTRNYKAIEANVAAALKLLNAEN
jgi:2-dehydro-3-deoxyphosphogluconate aldolase/(4S)-4-hydroxy-2-oxoglutarate aldolase